MPRLAVGLPRGVRARSARRRRLRPAPAARRHQPDDRARADRVLRGLRACSSRERQRSERSAGRTARGRSKLPLECQRLLRPRLLGGDPLPRRAPTPRTRPSASTCWRGLGEGLPARRRGPARARLWRRRVHAPLLRRVPRPARVRPATSSRLRRLPPPPRARSGLSRPPLDGRAQARRSGARALDDALARAPRRDDACSPRSARARSDCPAR